MSDRPILPPNAEVKTVLRRLYTYVRPHLRGLVAGVTCFFLAAAMLPLVPALFKTLLDSGFKADIGFPVWLVPLVVIGLFTVRGGLAFAGAYMMSWTSTKAVLGLRADLMGALMRAEATLYTQLSPGVAATRTILDPHNATNSLSGAITTILRDGTTLIALLAYLFWLNWQLTLISLLTAPLMALVVNQVRKRVMKIGGEFYETQVKLVGIVDDATRGWRVVRTFDAGEFERRRFEKVALELRRKTLKSVAAAATMSPLTQIVASFGIALILTLALLDAHRGGASVGEFVAFITALLMTITPMRHLTDVTMPIVTGIIGAQATFALMDTPPEPDRGSRVLDPAQTRGDIRFEDVSVVYPGSEQRALAGLNLEIAAGSTVALVGPSGSGKTTAVSAMLGFVTPASGRITLDGIDIAELTKSSLRRQFAVVSQDIVLFDGPIADNVAYAQPHDPARLEAALRAANLWDFVQAQPEGLEYTVGTNGSKLSGGQRQRLAIARALYKNAKVWVFDEATSALDTESERAVQQAIEQWHGQKTLILIAHRLSTVRNADCIYVLSGGRVVEQGRHEALLARGGLYAGMVNAQALE
jgi:subfamily B ATP-binding cassette protein MsbA